jgi:hypothetical protein
MQLSDLYHTDVIGSTIGLVGIILAAVFYFRGKEQSLPYYTVFNSTLIGKSGHNFPEKLAIEYDGKPVPSLSSSTIYFWNHGRKTLDKSDVVSSDPIVLHFKEGPYAARVLEIRSITVTREVIGVNAHPDGNKIELDFEFLDQADGLALTVLHTGGEQARVSCSGTIKGIPRGVSYLKSANINPPMKIGLVAKRAIQIGVAAICGLVGFGVLLYAVNNARSEVEKAEHPVKPSTPSFDVRFLAHVDPAYGIVIGVGLFLLLLGYFRFLDTKNIPVQLRVKTGSLGVICYLHPVPLVRIVIPPSVQCRAAGQAR